MSTLPPPFAAPSSTSATVAGDITLSLWGHSPAPTVEPGSYTYALSLENGRYYVGLSSNLLHRLFVQRIGKGARWVQRHPMLQVLEVYRHATREAAVAHESQLTRRYRQAVGAERIKGAGS